MSKPIVPDWIVEWSPLRVTAYDPAGKTQQGAASLDTLTIGSGRTILLALSRRSTFVKAIRVPDVSREQMLRVLQVSAGNHLPLPANEVAFDIHVTSDVTLEGRLVSLIAVRTEDLRDAIASARSIGHRVNRTVPLAWGSVFIADKLGLRDAVVVQKTDEGWAIDLVHDGGLRYSRLVPLETSDLEEEVARTCAASGIPCAEIVAAGGTEIEWATRKHPQTSLQALGDKIEALDLNLEPQEDVLRRLVHHRNVQTRSAVATATAAIALIGTIFFLQSSDAKESAAAVKRWQTRQAPIVKKKADLDSKATTIAAAQKDLDLAFKPGQHLSDALMAASNEITEGAWLTGASAERGKLLQLRGTALKNDNVTAFVKALSANPRFREVRLVFANQGQINKTPIVQFSVSAIVVANLPLPSPVTGAAGVKK